MGFDTLNKAATTLAAGKGMYKKLAGFQVKSLPELQGSPDSDLLIIGMELWKYDLQTFEELKRLLGIRNGAAHPGMFQPSALDVQQFATKVAGLVFKKITV